MGVILLDFSKAGVCRVFHSVLLQKLVAMRVDVLMQWIAAFFDHRSMSVVFDGVVSISR